MKGILLLSLFIVMVAKAFEYLVQPPREAITEAEEKPVKKPKSKRSIASASSQPVPAPTPYQSPSSSGPDYQINESPSFGSPDPEPVAPEPVSEAPVESSAPFYSSKGNGGSYPGPAAPVFNAAKTTSSQNSKAPEKTNFTTNGYSAISGSGATTAGGGFGAIVGLPSPTATTTTTNSDSPTTIVDSNIKLNCEASLQTGTYQKPTPTSLNCTTPAQIVYCIQEGTCCDPTVQGSTYSAPVIVGTEAKTYCLSFYGSKGKSYSSVVEKFYTFNPSAPNLTAAHGKKFFQTTQLPGAATMESSNFGNPDYTIGQINTKSTDPGPLGSNLSCSSLVETYTSLSPLPVETFVPTNMSSFLPSDQIEVFLRLPKLVYGNNFITSFAVHANYVDRAACSTTNVVLNDFAYFETAAILGDAGTNSVREFSGGFSPFGFFEEDPANINRGPAGLNVEAQGDQELRNGLFAVLF